ncbi:hypothetical protein GJ688_01940 [Heliobacillus mobilis]|uniref:Putative phage metallopeptidase domain-containing protein n=1 Tax=Heliobacterium mobile TaxID=28064 RepID=A0A6I3SC56_HELMO|nr:putative metallopeptidase [Heliobacterium mobile]MTV47743.1 hypothetical protein [Heliobacterium mobile]
MADVFFEDAPEVQDIARDLIEKHHGRLVEAKIKYLFRFGNWEVKGNTIYGRAQKNSTKDKYLTGFDFVILINGGVWVHLTEEQQEALVDHELCHCTRSEDSFGNPIWGIRDHDFTGFAAEVRRHGLWSTDLQLLKKAADEHHQLTLDFDEPMAVGAVSNIIPFGKELQ